MTGTGSHRIAWACAALASGPIFLVAYGAVCFVTAIPQPVVIAPGDVAHVLNLLLPVLLGGFIATMVPLFLAIFTLSALAASWRPLRLPLVWTLAGGAIAASIVLPFLADHVPVAVAAIATGMATMRLARACLSWPDLPAAARRMEPPARAVRSAG
jgi:hypothetical protein